MIDAHEIWAAAQTPPGEPMEEAVARIESLLADDQRDAERWRKLTSLLQSVYDGATFESESLDVYCYMQSGWKNMRTIQAELCWEDIKDMPLNLGSAIDNWRIE